MLFNSYFFIFLFLPLCLVGFYGLKKKQATLSKVWLTCFSLWFYGYFNISYLWIMIGSILGNYGLFRLLLRCKNEEKHGTINEIESNSFDKTTADTKDESKISTNSNETDIRRITSVITRKIVLITGVILNLGVLFYFKYYDFFLDNINHLFSLGLPLKHILLPLGISFFTFQQISFLADTYRGEIKQCCFLDYALFVSFFPQLIAGPIVTWEEMIPQFQQIGKEQGSKEERIECFSKGIYMFVLGLSKKVLLADTFGRVVDLAYGNVSGLNGLESLITILFYTIQLYFDFSGYCDMAKGIAAMFGFRIADNFNSPYKATNIVDFWKRWHMTLTRFFTRNVYIPLGGNRKGRGRMYGNLFLVFLLSGLWHGAGWNYILWGVMHGTLYVATRWWQNHKLKKKELIFLTDVNSKEDIDDNRKELNKKGNMRNRMPFIGRWCSDLKKTGCQILTFMYVNIAWVYFRAASVSQANTLLFQVFTKEWHLPSKAITEAFNPGEFWYALKILGVTKLTNSECYLIFIITLIALVIIFEGKNVKQLADTWKPSIGNACLTAFLFVWSVVSLSGVSTFLYFNF